jgi:uncharacterized repeat protein (TIGR03803 family)
MLLAVGAASPAFAQYTLTTLASFNGTNGQFPIAGLLMSGGTLYGTTGFGGVEGDGNVYSLPVSGGTPTVLATFAVNSAAGYTPQGNLTVSGSTLYGTTTQGGGGFGAGDVFSLPVTGGTPSVVASFIGTDGLGLSGGVVLTGSTLYGTTSQGGMYNEGVVFSAPISGGTPSVLTSFGAADGSDPNGVIISGGTLYGTTYDGGNNEQGEVYSLPVTGGSPAILAPYNSPNGSSLSSELILSDGILYGTAEGRGLPNGVNEVFSVPVTGGTPTILASFPLDSGTAINGGGPLLLSDGILYGTSYKDGAYGDGEVFSVPADGGPVSVLVSFNGADGLNPDAGLLMDASGNLYGTTEGGGANSDGTVFELVVPEPTSISLLAIGSLALLRRRARTRLFGQPQLAARA